MAKKLKSKKTGVIFSWSDRMAQLTEEYEVINTSPDVAFEQPPVVEAEVYEADMAIGVEVPEVDAEELTDVDDS